MSRVSRIVMRTISVLGIILFISVLVLAWRRGIFLSQKAMTDFVIGLGIWGPLVFTLIQIIQVIIPIIPGGHQLSCRRTDVRTRQRFHSELYRYFSWFSFNIHAGKNMRTAIT